MAEHLRSYTLINVIHLAAKMRSPCWTLGQGILLFTNEQNVTLYLVPMMIMTEHAQRVYALAIKLVVSKINTRF